MAITKVINDAVDLNQTTDYSGLRLPVGTTADVIESFTTDYLVVAGGGGTGTDSPGGGGAGGLRTSYNNSTTTTNTLSFPSGKTAVATYMLNNNATDVSGNYNGAETNITYNTGQYGGGAVFNGSSSVIQLGTNIFKYTNVTISAFINPSLSNTSVKTIFGNTSYVNGQSFYGIIISVRNDGSSDKIYVQHYPSATAVYSTGTIPLNTFTHVAVSYTGSQTKIYINGSLDSTHSASLSYSASQTLTASLGAYLLHDYTGSTTYDEFSGTIDQVRIYNSALSSTDVTNIYNNEVQANSGGGSVAESSLTLTAGVAYDVTVGAGGFKTFGSNSVFSIITSSGGGSGGGSGSSSGYNGGNGGSGGGASGGGYSLPGGNGTTAQGYAGGGSGSQAGSGYPGGGGGGASAKGQTLATSSDNGGAGGNGVITNILNSTNAASASVGEVSGSNVYYSGGGGGSTYTTTLGAGGLGGGADGQKYIDAQTTNNGTANTGGGGGAQNSTGGSGVVILRYPTASVSSFTTTGTLNTPSTTDTIADTAYPVANTAYYKLDNSAIDLSGSTGKFDQAGVFNGSSSYIQADGIFSSSPSVMSASVWFKTTVDGNILDIGDSSVSTAQNRIFFSSGLLYVSLNGGGGGFASTSATGLQDGNWHHIVAVWDDGTVTNGIKMYIDGATTPTAQANSTQSFTSALNLFIGANDNRGSSGSPSIRQYFNGSIDQVRIYNVALSSTDVTALYNETVSTTGTLSFPSGQTAIATYELNGNANGILTTTDLSTVNYPAGAGCIALYEMNGTADDTSGAYNGTPSNIDYNFGAFGQAAVFNGSSSRIDTNFVSNLTSASYSFWVNIDSGTNGRIISSISANPIQDSQVNITLLTNGDLQFAVQAGGAFVSGTASGAINYDTWYHIALTYSSGGYLKGYINGTEVSSVSIGTINAGSNTTPLYIGFYPRLSTYELPMSFDQLRIFNTELTQAQVTTLARGIGTSYSGVDTDVLYAYNGTPTNVTYGNGRFGQAAEFSGGSSGSIVIPNSTNLAQQNNYTFSAWFKTDTTGVTQTIYAFNSPSTFQSAIFIHSNGTNNIRIFSAGSNYYSSNNVYTNNQWYHIAVTKSSANGIVAYLDGNVIINEPTATANNTQASAGDNRIGGYKTTATSSTFDGSIDQVRIFSTALTSAQVSQLYNEHYQTQFTDGSDTAIVFTQGTGTVTFSGVDPAPPQGALRTNTSYSEDGSASVIEHYNGTDWKYFDAIKYCTTNTLNFPSGAGCIASYNLNNNVDDIGNTYNGINSNVTFNASGKFGAAAVFNGSSSEISFGNQNWFDNNFSASLWININSLSGSALQMIMSKRNNSDYTDPLSVYVYEASHSSQPNKIRAQIGEGSSSCAIYLNTTATAGSWIHLVFTFDGTTLKGYFNGALETTDTFSGTRQTNSSSIRIGNKYNTNGDYPFDGSIDQVRIFNDSLTSDEVSKLYNNEIACS